MSLILVSGHYLTVHGRIINLMLFSSLKPLSSAPCPLAVLGTGNKKRRKFSFVRSSVCARAFTEVTDPTGLMGFVLGCFLLALGLVVTTRS